jgi:hypothetical protein
LFSVFTAWKSLAKESRILNKYLRECNFQSKPKSSYADLSSIVQHDDEETNLQLSFANHLDRYSTAEAKVISRDLNFLYGSQPESRRY